MASDLPLHLVDLDQRAARGFAAPWGARPDNQRVSNTTPVDCFLEIL